MNENMNNVPDNNGYQPVQGQAQFGNPQPAPYVTTVPAQKKPNRFLLILRGLFYPLLYTVVQTAVLIVYMIVKAVALAVSSIASNGDPYDAEKMITQLITDLEGQYIALIIAAVLTFVIVLIITKARKKTLKEEFHLKAIDPRVGILAFVSGITLNFSVLFAMNFLPQDVLDKYAENVQYTGSLVIYILAGVICAPIIEELLYRNFTLVRFKSAMPTWLAVILSAAVFGIAHWNLVQSTYAALLGAFLALMFIRTDSIFTGILVHFGFNCVSIISLVLEGIEMTEQTEAIVNIVFFGVMIVSIAICVFSVIGIFLLTSKDRESKTPSVNSVGISGESV